MAEFDNKTCTRLEVQEGTGNEKKVIFVKSEWKPTRSEPTSFDLSVSDGLRAWRFEGSESFVNARAEAWDKRVGWVMEKLKFYLSVGQPGVIYRFTPARDNQRKLSFDIEDGGSDLSLTANFSLVNASDPESVTCDLLGFLYDGNCRLTERYLKKCRDLTLSVKESTALVEENTRLKNVKVQYEEDIYKKFAAVLNTKKSKLRELKKENEKLREESKSKVKEEDERDDTTYSSTEDEGDEEESDHQRSTPEKKMKRNEAFSKRLVSGEPEPVSTSGANVVNADPDATQPFLDEIENDAPVVEPPKEDPPSLPALVGDAPYVGLQRKRRRN